MRKLDLAGEWLLSQDGGEPICGRLPGCTYLDYMANGMADPFWSENETEANELAHHAYRYSRKFTLDEETLAIPHLELVVDGLDTICTVSVNGKHLADAENINRVWRWDLKALCTAGENELTLDFADPYKVIDERHAANPLHKSGTPMAGVGHIRKTPCHFGWDWGPALPPAGVTRSIGIEAYSFRLDDIWIKQTHKDGKVSLDISAQIEYAPASACAKLVLTDPDGAEAPLDAVIEDGVLKASAEIDKPKLWWCNGLGEQPLYKVSICVEADGESHCCERKIGLRTIELDTHADEHGNQFRFVVNGVPIFAKGADWIPADSFPTRADRETIFFYINAAKRANMNMLRIWGGGVFESEDFYDACDEYGILVWQDFPYACNVYPTNDDAFIENVHAESVDNIRRLRHRASLALWSGNNECEAILPILKKGNIVRESNYNFYYNVLSGWVKELDGTTPYWPGSPSSSIMGEIPQRLKEGRIRGDSHLWQIWHGMYPIEAFRDMHTRFCSEFGMETMPSMQTVRSFTDDPSPELLGSVMQLHQKSNNGNEKILYYLLAKYREPKKFEDFVYLSQLVQANTVRSATDSWRRAFGRSNGSLFWQLNDCWPVASWSGIDYGRQQKAVMYHARHFNKMLCLSNNYYKDRAEIYVENDYPDAFEGEIKWCVKRFDGGYVSGGRIPAKTDGVSSSRAAVLVFRDILGKASKKDCVLEAQLIGKGGEVLDTKLWLLVPDKDARLPKVKPELSCAVENGIATVTLFSNLYARYVYLEADGVKEPWSDNFFDIPAGTSVSVSVKLPDSMSADEFAERLTVKTLTDPEPKYSAAKDRRTRRAIMGKPANVITYIFAKLVLG